MRRKAARARNRRVQPAGARVEESVERGQIVPLVEALADRPETGTALTAGDVDADWMRAHDSGEETPRGTVATPDQDVVDEIGRALGLEQPPDAEVRTSEEILRDRGRFRWHLERKAADAEEGRPSRPPRQG